MMDGAAARTTAALNPPPTDVSTGLHHGVTAHPYHGGQSTPWEGLLSEWFLPASSFSGQTG